MIALSRKLCFLAIASYIANAVGATDPTQLVLKTDQEDLEVDTLSGKILGRISPNTDNKVREFLGIPFANPPDRFAEAQAVTPWTDTKETTQFGHSCMQQWNEATVKNVGPLGVEEQEDQSEDCLFLNVFAPVKSRAKENELATVMVWIHGGAFYFGSSSDYNGAIIPRDHDDIIIVSINYRLNIFGFPWSPSLPKDKQNLGLLDQKLALQWVHDNIESFGGDPAKITLFGQSAGAASVDLYTLTNPTNPIPRAAILESGTALLAASIADPLNNMVDFYKPWEDLSQKLECDREDPAENFECMKEHPAENIKIALDGSTDHDFPPKADNITMFTKAEILRRYREGLYSKMPTLIGSNHNEGTLPLANLPPALITLAAFSCPAGITSLQRVRHAKPTWRYRYFGDFPNTHESGVDLKAFHSAEIGQVFGTYNNTKFGDSTEEQIKSSTYIQGAWVTFAKNPTRGLKDDLGWPIYGLTLGQKSLIELTKNNTPGMTRAYGLNHDHGCALLFPGYPV